MAFSYNAYKESEETKKAKKLKDQYNTYKESTAVANARAAMQQQERNRVADWTGGAYGDSMKQALDKITNRQAFTYDLNGDALYQQYRDQYVNLGKMAMQDATGQAAALTGGYGNSYASTVGNQAYQGYLQQLNDRIPELYNLALSKYEMEGNQLKDQYAILADRYNTDYGEYRDKLSDWNTEMARLTDAYNNERNYDRSTFESDRSYYNDAYNQAYNRDYGAYTDAYNRAFAQYQQQVADEQWQKQYDENIRQYNDKMAYQRERDAIADQQAAAELALKQQQYAAEIANASTKTTTSQKKTTTSQKTTEEETKLYWDDLASAKQKSYTEKLNTYKSEEDAFNYLDGKGFDYDEIEWILDNVWNYSSTKIHSQTRHDSTWARGMKE